MLGLCVSQVSHAASVREPSGLCGRDGSSKRQVQLEHYFSLSLSLLSILLFVGAILNVLLKQNPIDPFRKEQHFASNPIFLLYNFPSAPRIVFVLAPVCVYRDSNPIDRPTSLPFCYGIFTCHCIAIPPSHPSFSHHHLLRPNVMQCAVCQSFVKLLF